MNAMNDSVPIPLHIFECDPKTGKYKRLAIDDVIDARIAAPRRKIVKPAEEARYVCRRAMQIGFESAAMATNERPAPTANDFARLEELAKHALTSLNALINYLQPGAETATELELSIVTSQTGLQPGDPLGQHLQALADASTILAARGTIKRLSEIAGRKEARVRKGIANPGKPEERAFTLRMAEAWIFLTGHAPSRTPDHCKNPFLPFVSTAWADVFNDDEIQSPDKDRFIGGLRQLPNWNEYQLGRLRAQGPHWL